MKKAALFSAPFAALIAALCHSPLVQAQDDVPPHGWYRQRAVTPEFSFSAYAGPGEVLATAVKSIKVIDRKTGNLVQRIRVDAIDGWSAPDGLVHLVDANVDGHPDIVVDFATGGAGPNSSSRYYLYDPASRKFVLHRKLSELTQTSINADGTISAAARNGCCQHYEATYRFINGKLTLIADVAIVHEAEWKTTTTRKLVNGKWKSTTKRVPDSE